MATTKEALFAFRAPAPLRETYKFPLNDWEFEIQGLQSYSQSQKLYELRTKFLNDKYFKVTFHDETYRPSDDHIVAAVWASLCCTNPTMTPEEWMCVAHDAPGLLEMVAYRAQVCSRLRADIDDAGNIITPDGVEAAKESLSADPLDSDVSSQDTV